MSGVSSERQFAAQGMVIAAAVLWSTSGLFIQLIDWHPVVIAGSRGFLAAAFLAVVRSFFPPQKPAAANATSAFNVPLLVSAIAHALMVITFVVANRLTAPANAVLLQYSSPIWTALLAWRLLKEKPRWENWLALVLVAAGLLIFFRGGLASGALTGDLLGLTSGVFIAIHVVFLRMSKDNSPHDVLLACHATAAIISIPFVFLYPPSLSLSNVIPMLYMGVIQQGIASLFIVYGIKRISAIKTMITCTIEPILNPVWVLLVFGQIPSLSAISGGGIIVVAVLSSSVIGERRDAAQRRTAALGKLQAGRAG